MLDMLIPEQTVLSSQQITIGKIYAAKLIYESFKEIKRRKNCTLPQFAVSLALFSFFFCWDELKKNFNPVSYTHLTLPTILLV